MLFTIAYQAALLVLGLAAVPKLLYQYFAHRKYKGNLLRRMGIGLPAITKQGRPFVWIHAVSVGETKAAAVLVKLLKTKLNNPMILVSSVTETGHAEAKMSIPEAEYHIYMPFDFLWIIRPFVRRVQPSLVVMSETDLWYNFLKSCKETGALTVVVNAKVSARSTRRLQSLRWFSKKLFAQIDLLCVQSAHYMDRFRELGVCPDKVKVTGNLKFDHEPPRLSGAELDLWRSFLGIKQSDKVLVIGSTHDPEERLILEQLRKVWKTVPGLKVVIVPRHPERFDQVAALIARAGIPFVRYSQLTETAPSWEVLLVDAMGILTKCYQVADAAVVAGSYTNKVGGHNILEPIYFGVPVIFGPYMHAQPELEELVNEFGAGLQLPLDKMETGIAMLTSANRQADEVRKAGERLLASSRGSVLRTVEAMERYVL